MLSAAEIAQTSRYKKGEFQHVTGYQAEYHTTAIYCTALLYLCGAQHGTIVPYLAPDGTGEQP